MKKFLFVSVALLASSFISTAAPVDSQRAELTARKFFFGEYGTKVTAMDLTFVGDSHSLESATKSAPDGFEFVTPAYYIYNRFGGGYVIISGEDSVDPVVGYSLDGEIDLNNLPPQLEWWLEGVRHTIDRKRTTGAVASYDVALHWNNISSNTQTKADTGKRLYTPTWSQSSPFNDNVPAKSSGGDNCPCGCVATAMTELMRYYEWPSEPSDETVPRYTDSNSHTIDARDLTDRVYDWANMPTTGSGAASAKSEIKQNIATLLADVGASVKMNYKDGGSGAYSERIVNSMGTYFKYSKNARLLYRNSYSEQEFVDMMVASIDAGQPILAAGSSTSGGGHQFVVDGYNSDHLMYFNWGWNSSSNGYYAVGVNTYYIDFSIILDLVPDKSGSTSFGRTTLHYDTGNSGTGIKLYSGTVAKGSEFNMYTGSALIPSGPKDFVGYLRLSLVNREETDTVDITGDLMKSSSFTSSIGYYHSEFVKGKITRDLELGDRIILQSSESKSGPWDQVLPYVNGAAVLEYPAFPYSFIDLPEQCIQGSQFELTLKNSPYIWYNRVKWYIAEPGQDEGTLSTSRGQGALKSNDRYFYTFSKTGIYKVKVEITDDSGKIIDTIVSRIQVK